MSKIILGIHGLGNKPPSATLYENGWVKAILEGLSLNENILLNSLPFEGVYWANLRNAEPDQEGEIYRPAQVGSLRRYDEGFIENVIQKVEELGGGILDWFKENLEFERSTNRVLESKLVDLHEYYANPTHYEQLTSLLIEKLESHAGKKIMLVAHSMGSIIAYDALRRIGRQTNTVSIDHFITIGSPLGLPHVVMNARKKHGMPRTPTVVKRWTNFADRRDPVASDEHLRDDYKANVAGIRVDDNLVLNDWRVKSGIDIFHKSYGYLRTPEFSRALAEFV